MDDRTAKVTFRLPDGSEQTLEVSNGTSVMHAAVAHGIPGIIGECGGSAMCATCHVYVEEQGAANLTAVSDDEDEMLDCTAAERRSESRLSCQLVADESLDGLVVRVPGQH